MLKIIFTVVGTYVGAGFASGKEIHLFFFRFGFLGIIGIIISSIFVGIILSKTLKIIVKNNIKTYESFLNKIIKKRAVKIILNRIINLFLIFTFGVMISGFCSFLKQEFCINKVVSGFLILTSCYCVFQKNINKIVKINNLLVPIIILIIIYIVVFKSNNYKFYFIENEIKINYFFDNYLYILLTKIKLRFDFFTKALLYSNYNLLGIIPVLIATKQYITKSKSIKIIPIFVSLIIGLLSVCVFLLLSRLGFEKNTVMLNLEMPIIYVVSKFGLIYKFIYTCIVGIAIFTTAITSGYGYLQKYEYDKDEFNKSLWFLIIEAIAFIPISFSNLISILYPFFGIIGLIQSYYIIKYKT